MMKSDNFRISTALKLISLRFPIGVDIIKRAGLFLVISLSFTIIISCSPQNYSTDIIAKKNNKTTEFSIDQIDNKNNLENIEDLIANKNKISKEIEIILPRNNYKKITRDFINSFELALYKKKIENINLNINLYSTKEELNNIISSKALPGKIFIGPLTSEDVEEVDKFCSKKIIFFSFASDRTFAKDCIYLVNFFPEDDLINLFNYFEKDSKIALLYPENNYGLYINSIIDDIANRSKSIIINRASYNNDLSNSREAIKRLSNYEIRKKELERQKNILKSKDDDFSKKALKKIERFETAGTVEFTHLILPEYNIRLLQIAPLLPFYDIDPKKVQFVGTGVWDNTAFFYEPSLQGAIFPGIAIDRREGFMDSYYNNYNEEPSRTITIPYDLIGMIAYIVNKEMFLEEVKILLNDDSVSFEGIDGKFSFVENVISRELDILKISKGKANSLD